MSSFRSALAVLLVSVLAACAIENPSTINRPDGGPCGEAGQQCCFEPGAGVDAGRSLCTGSNTTCIAGSCVACGGPTSTLCGTGDSRVCVDLNTNANCGACGNACAPGTQCESISAAGDAGVSGGMDAGRSDAGAAEDAGPNAPMFVCRTVCVGGLSRCGDVCRDLTTDQQNCGRCGNACTFPNGVAACQSSACRLAACVANFGNCDMMDGNGCETDFRSTVTHCGACGNACNLPNATPVCTNGACRVGSCNPGFADCDGNPANGCEVDTRVSVANCGMCGNACPPPPVGGMAVCVSGACTVGLMCPSGRGDCNAMSADGCETNTTNSVANCGACGTTCTVMNGTPACTASVCTVGGCTGTFRDCDGMYVNGCEVNTNTSAANCGACNRTCTLPNVATQACSSGTCVVASPSSCAAGFANCDGMNPNGCEVNLQTDSNNCGACNNVCPSGQRCQAGVCTTTCATGLTNCTNVCRDLQTDNANCGMCGRACPAGQSCNAGVCACPTGQDYCSSISACVNFQNDSNNCGMCGRVCPSGQRCGGGTCSTSCPSTQTNCGGTCRDTRNDPLACGSCATTCSFTGGVAGCTSSACTLLACNSGRGNCDGNNSNGCETDTNASATNCGVCGNGCQFANAAASCSMGRCVMGACNTGFADCNNNPIDGCETNVASGDTSNCGMCGTACGTPPVGATYSCTGSMCRLSTLTCPADRRNCDGNDSNGCETFQLTDVLNCGACGNVCSQTGGTRSCVGGTCRIACTTGLGDCDGSVTNGCETNLNTSAANCGLCGRACSLANATAGCASGACTVASCNTGFANCNGTAGDGCEVNTQNDNNNCGACGNVCPGGQRCSAGTCVSTCPTGQIACGSSCVTTSTDPDNCGGCSMVCSNNNIAARTCTASACSGACSTGFADCNTNLRSDGCEVNLNTNATNCGGCGMACSTNHVTAACSGGVCNGACAAGFADCNTNKRSDGCETETTMNVSNCGGCGNVCPTRANATTTCASSACGFTCSAGFGNCNTMDGDGCEAPLNTVTNCGACGTMCPARANATATCTGTTPACGFTCSAGFADCNTTPGDGCETTLATTPAHCGACGAACPAAGVMNADGGCAMSRCTCTPNHGDCNGSRADGCEANLQNDDANCGACGNACPTGQTCMSGACG